MYGYVMKFQTDTCICAGTRGEVDMQTGKPDNDPGWFPTEQMLSLSERNEEPTFSNTSGVNVN